MIEKIDTIVWKVFGVRLVEVVVLLALAVAVISQLIYWHITDTAQTEAAADLHLTPTAGIVYYMARLEYYSMRNAKAQSVVIKKEEKEDHSVSAPAQAFPGLTPEDCLIRLFGYVPSDYDMELLYKAVQCEVGWLEPDNGAMAVVYVIANRCREGKMTIYEVLSAPNQFETWSNGAIQNCNEVDEYFVEIIDDVISEDPFPEYRDLMFFTSGYYNPYCEPAFIIGHHYFGRIKNEV